MYPHLCYLTNIIFIGTRAIGLMSRVFANGPVDLGSIHTLDPYLIILSIKQGGIKYHFLSLWYDSTCDWTQISWAFGEHSNHNTNVQ